MPLDNEEKKINTDISIKPFKFINLDKLEIKKSIYSHTYLHIKGLIKEENAAEYLDYLNEDYPEIIVKYKAARPGILFRGFVTDYDYYFDEYTYSLNIKAVSYSKLLALQEKTRIYQNMGTSYNDIFAKLCEENDINIRVTDSSSGRELFVSRKNPVRIQYMESDWHFLRRICSYLNVLLIVDDMNEGGKKINLQIGVSDSPVREVDFLNWAFVEKINPGTGYASYYMIERYKDDILVPGMRVSFNYRNESDEKLDFVLIKSRIYLDNNSLYTDSAFIREDDFYIEDIDRKHSIAGKTFKGEIMQISTDKRLKIYFLELEDDFDVYRSFWFPLSCVYWNFSKVLKVGDIVDVCLFENFEQNTDESSLLAGSVKTQELALDLLINEKIDGLLDNLILDLYSRNSLLTKPGNDDLDPDFMELFWIRYKKEQDY